MIKVQNNLMSITPLFLLLFIDGMGLGLLFPILNSLMVDPNAGFLMGDYSNNSREFLYGLIIATFMISCFFGSAILGDLSDSIGRKKSLLICLLGASLGYLFSALAIPFHSLFLLTLGRIIAGFTAGSQPIAQAAILDISTQEVKSRNIGFAMLAVSLGFLLGPMIGGVLSHSELIPWFNFSTPFYFAATISLINAIMILAIFHETHAKTKKVQVKLTRAINIFVIAFQRYDIRKLSCLLLLTVFGWGSYYSFITIFLFNRYGFDALKNAVFLSLVAVGCILGSGVIVNFCNKKFNLKSSIAVSLVIAAFASLFTVVFQNIILVCFFGVIIGAAISVAYPNILTLFSNQVSENERGWIMGVTGSIGAICFGMTSLLAGAVSFLGYTAPLFISFIGLILACILMLLQNTKSYPTLRDNPSKIVG